MTLVPGNGSRGAFDRSRSERERLALLYRQVHPSHVRRDGFITSSTFDPLRGGGREGADTRALSVYNGDLIAPQDAFDHYTGQLNLASLGVLGIDEDECRDFQVDVVHDAVGYPEHSTSSFARLSRRRIPIVERKLRDLATERGWLHGPVDVGTV